MRILLSTEASTSTYKGLKLATDGSGATHQGGPDIRSRRQFRLETPEATVEVVSLSAWMSYLRPGC